MALRLTNYLAIAAIAFGVGACSYGAETAPVASYDMVTSYSTKIHGRYLLVVSSEVMDMKVRSINPGCRLPEFPLVAADAFRESAAKSLGNLVDGIELVDDLVPLDQLRTRRIAGQIVIRVEEPDVRLDIGPGYPQGVMAADVRLVASAQVDGPAGRLFGQTFEGKGKGSAPFGFACSGGGDALKQGVEAAVRDLMRRIGEGIANSDRVRSGKAS